VAVEVQMSTQTEAPPEPRIPLTRERVLQAAVDLADRRGLKSLTMRNLAHELGVEAMSLYYHVANKEEVFDGMVDVVVGEINEVVTRIDPPAGEADWKPVVRRTILSAREVLLMHPWAPEVLETRSNLSEPTLRYFDSLCGLFRGADFSFDLIHHGMHALGSRALGFTQEMFDEGDDDVDPDAAAAMLEQMADRFPNITEMTAQITHDDDDSVTLGWCDDQTEFEFGLDLILDGLERLRGAV